jgi:cyclohexanecarboxyl-CoA dehydrogenase
MDFGTSPDQRALVAAARDFSVRRLAPYYHQRELEGALDRATIAEMGARGLLGIELPEALGGLGLDCVTAGLVTEALCADDYNIGYVTITVSLAGQILRDYGDPSVVAPWIAGMLRGELIPCIALTEPAGGSDAASIALRAVRDGDHYLLTGEKTSISMATQADFSVLFVRTGAVADRHRGISALLVPLDDPSITRTAFEDHGGRCAGRGSLHFDEVRVPVTNLLGDENAGFHQVMSGFDYSRALIALQCLAAARSSLDATWRYAESRETFGRRLVEHQGVAFPLAEAETHLEAARLLCLRALWLKDQGLAHSAEAAMCKWWAPQLAYDIVRTCLLTHGHAGYSTGLPFEQRLRDLLGLQIGDGTSQIMKMVIARRRARELSAGGRGI